MLLKGKHCVITGGAGMLGSCLSRLLLNMGNMVTIYDNFSRGMIENVPPGARLIKCDLLKGLRHPPGPIDYVFHLAARVGGVGYIKMSDYQSLANAAIDKNVFDFALEAGAKIIYASTACVYPVTRQDYTNRSEPLDEDEALHPGAQPESLYGWVKLAGEIALERLTSETGLPSAVLRFFNIYGPGERPDLKTAHAIPALILKAIRARHTSEPITVWGSGKQSRSFLFVEDAARALILAAVRCDVPRPINIGSPEPITIAGLASMIRDLIAPQAQLVFDPSEPEGVAGRSPKIDRARSLLLWEPTTPLEVGIEKTYLWIQEKIALA
ncbi:MAG: NAD-dependent epimerase/dehydratase family protein [bacterium JZ-2024 1]